MCYLDDAVTRGSWNVITAWFWPRQEPLVVIPEPHHHEEHEVVQELAVCGACLDRFPTNMSE